MKSAWKWIFYLNAQIEPILVANRVFLPNFFSTLKGIRGTFALFLSFFNLNKWSSWWSTPLPLFLYSSRNHSQWHTVPLLLVFCSHQEQPISYIAFIFGYWQISTDRNGTFCIYGVVCLHPWLFAPIIIAVGTLCIHPWFFVPIESHLWHTVHSSLVFRSHWEASSFSSLPLTKNRQTMKLKRKELKSAITIPTFLSLFLGSGPEGDEVL